MRIEIDRFDPMPLYQQVARAIRDEIRAGRLQPRDPIPSESALVQNGIARETARRAVALLRREGWVITLPQRGSYVAPREQWPDESGEGERAEGEA